MRVLSLLGNVRTRDVYKRQAEGRSEFHNGALTMEQYEQAIREVKAYVAE